MKFSVRSALFGVEKGAWTKFFVALGGLTLAFGAAVFSTVANQAGNLWATAILASAALLLAGFVGVTTVPYLARRAALARVHNVLDYDLTREGVIYIALSIVIGIAALNTGNNLLFIVLSAMLAAMIVSGVASAVVLRGLELEAVLPMHVFAKHAVLGSVLLRNRRRFLPSFSVSVAPLKPKKGKRFHWERSVFVFPPRRLPGREWLRLPDWSLRLKQEHVTLSGIFQGTVYFPYIPPKVAVSADVDLRFPRRGRYLQESLGLTTRFPFSFLIKTRHVPLSREMIVFPCVEPTDAALEVLPMMTGEFESFVRGRGYDLYRIREYMPEDSARHVDWKATAKSGSLKVREFTREDERKLRIVFDNPAPGLVADSDYENAVALGASLGWYFAAGDMDLSFVAPGYCGTDIYEFLTCLALVEPKHGKSVLEELELTDDYNLILTARPRGTIPTALWLCSYFVFMNGRK